jgi:hypothetical protein
VADIKSRESFSSKNPTGQFSISPYLINALQHSSKHSVRSLLDITTPTPDVKV